MAGVSSMENKGKVTQWIDELKPKTVLDIGAGMGTYSILARRPGSHWTALEVFYPYVSMFDLQGKYDWVVIGDARYVDYKAIGRSELIIAADMLEHMPKDDAKALIAKLLENCDYLLISIPIVHHEQHAGHEGNNFEEHVDHWEAEEMRDYLAFQSPIDRTLVGDTLAYFLVRSESL